MKHLTAIFFLFACAIATCHAQHEELDSSFVARIEELLAQEERKQAALKVISDFENARLQRERQFDYTCLYPLCEGIITSATQRGFIRHEGTVPAKSDRFSKTDYAVAGIPLATAWALKAAGVKSRSTTERMATASALSMAMTFGLAKGVKTLADEQRPDGSDCKSMPSGHTAFAFASASILAREYGDLSPWLAVGGFATATGTQYLRLRHNRHWVNDLYMGAGIGMLSTNIGYWLTDKLLPNEGILTPPEVRLRDMQRVATFNNQPTGAALVSGTEFGQRTFDIDGMEVKAQAAFTMGAEVSWFLNQLVALELMARSTTGYAKVYSPTAAPCSADDMLMYHVDLAAKYSYPFILGQRAHVRAFAGMRHTSSLCFVGDDGTTLRAPAKSNLEAGCGFGYEAIDCKNYAIGVNCDYLHSFAGIIRNRFCVSTTWKILF